MIESLPHLNYLTIIR